jgi:hypothetical protein
MWWIMMVNLLFPSLALFFAKLFSDIIFYTKKNVYKKKGVKNFFTTSESINKKHIITDNRINSAITKSKRSLRGIVMNNRENIRNSEKENTAIMLHNGR